MAEKLSKQLQELLNDAEANLSELFLMQGDIRETNRLIIHLLIPSVLKIPRDDISDEMRGFFLQMQKGYNEYLEMERKRQEETYACKDDLDAYLTAEIDWHKKQIPVLQNLADWSLEHMRPEISFVLALVLVDSIHAEVTSMKACIVRSTLQKLHPEAAEKPRKKKGKRRPDKGDGKERS